MLYDLRSLQPMQAEAVGMLAAAVRWNFNRLKQSVSDMTMEELYYTGPNQAYNSTAQLIRHLTFVDLNWAYRIKGEAMPEQLISKYGPMLNEQGKLPEVEGLALEQLISEYESIISLIEQVCTQLREADLDIVVRFGHQNEKQATLRWGIWHIADHSRYHQAHINVLRKWYKLYCLNDK